MGPSGHHCPPPPTPTPTLSPCLPHLLAQSLTCCLSPKLIAAAVHCGATAHAVWSLGSTVQRPVFSRTSAPALLCYSSKHSVTFSQWCAEHTQARTYTLCVPYTQRATKTLFVDVFLFGESLHVALVIVCCYCLCVSLNYLSQNIVFSSSFTKCFFFT